MKKNPIVYFILLLFMASGMQTYAQELQASKIPSHITFNGYVTDREGNSLSGDNYNFIVHVYDSPFSKTPLLSQSYENVDVKEGVFTLNIGSDDKNILTFNKKYYLGIQINGEEEMPQRLEFGTTMYSLGARYANTVSDGSITTEKLQDNSVTSDKIKSLSISKITDLPDSINTLEKLRSVYHLSGSDYEWWTTFGNIIYGPERHFIGTRNKRDFVIQTFETDRMRFDAFGYILLGTVEHPVDFEVFGYSIFDYLFIDGNLGVGVDPALAKMHINAPPHKNPLRIDFHNSPIFTIDTLGRVEITSTVSGNDGEENNYAVEVSGGEQGIGIDINGNADGDNNYVSFWDDNGMEGRIEGQTAAEYAAEPMSIGTDAFLAALIVAEGVAAASFLYPLPIPTEPADIIRIGADIAELSFGIAWDYAHLGITYESGSGDYSEWLERNDHKEIISAGDIVGVKGGKISKNTINAEKLMAISTSPVILGNMPQIKNESNFEKVAFMGQVPVKVRGAVNYGDFIIPSGLNDGAGIAVAPELMTIDELEKVVGRAWSVSSNESIKPVNVLVGISASDIAQICNQRNSARSAITLRSDEVERETMKLKSKLYEIKKAINRLNENFPKGNPESIKVSFSN